MSQPATWDDARSLVGDRDLIRSVGLIKSWLQGHLDFPDKQRTIRAWLDELIIHTARINSLEDEARRGRLTKEKYNVELNEISANILSLVTKIESTQARISSSAPVLAPPSSGDERLQIITGSKSRLQMVSWLERGIQCSTAVCRLMNQSRRGTGFRTDSDLIVTNHHVIGTAEEASNFLAQFFFEEALDGKLKDPINITLDSSRFWTSSELDVTVVGANFANSSIAASVVTLPIEKKLKVEIGDPVSIIQHPLGGPKQIALTSNQVVKVADPWLQYVTDTLPGSSGSPVFDASWNVIAVHHAGGTLVKNPKGENVFANEGVCARSFGSIREINALMTRVVKA